jgi:hypothetical protein
MTIKKAFLLPVCAVGIALPCTAQVRDTRPNWKIRERLAPLRNSILNAIQSSRTTAVTPPPTPLGPFIGIARLFVESGGSRITHFTTLSGV